MGGSFISYILVYMLYVVVVFFWVWLDLFVSVVRGLIRLLLRVLFGVGGIIFSFSLLFKGYLKKKVWLYV